MGMNSSYLNGSGYDKFIPKFRTVIFYCLAIYNIETNKKGVDVK